MTHPEQGEADAETPARPSAGPLAASGLPVANKCHGQVGRQGEGIAGGA